MRGGRRFHPHGARRHVATSPSRKQDSSHRRHVPVTFFSLPLFIIPIPDLIAEIPTRLIPAEGPPTPDPVAAVPASPSHTRIRVDSSTPKKDWRRRTSFGESVRIPAKWGSESRGSQAQAQPQAQTSLVSLAKFETWAVRDESSISAVLKPKPSAEAHPSPSSLRGPHSEKSPVAAAAAVSAVGSSPSRHGHAHPSSPSTSGLSRNRLAVKSPFMRSATVATLFHFSKSRSRSGIHGSGGSSNDLALVDDFDISQAIEQIEKIDDSDEDVAVGGGGSRPKSRPAESEVTEDGGVGGPSSSSSSQDDPDGVSESRIGETNKKKRGGEETVLETYLAPPAMYRRQSDEHDSSYSLSGFSFGFQSAETVHLSVDRSIRSVVDEYLRAQDKKTRRMRRRKIQLKKKLLSEFKKKKKSTHPVRKPSSSSAASSVNPMAAGNETSLSILTSLPHSGSSSFLNKTLLILDSKLRAFEDRKAEGVSSESDPPPAAVNRDPTSSETRTPSPLNRNRNRNLRRRNEDDAAGHLSRTSSMNSVVDRRRLRERESEKIARELASDGFYRPPISRRLAWKQHPSSRLMSRGKYLLHFDEEDAERYVEGLPKLPPVRPSSHLSQPNHLQSRRRTKRASTAQPSRSRKRAKKKRRADRFDDESLTEDRWKSTVVSSMSKSASPSSSSRRRSSRSGENGTDLLPRLHGPRIRPSTAPIRPGAGCRGLNIKVSRLAWLQS